MVLGPEDGQVNIQNGTGGCDEGASTRSIWNLCICRDEVDYLPEDRVYCLRCFRWFLFLRNPVGYRITPPVATLNIRPIANAVSEWDANDQRKILSTVG